MACPHEAERLLATFTAIAFQSGGLSPDFFPPPPVDEFGRVGLPPANVPLAPYKAEYLARKRGVKIVDGEPVAILEEKQKQPAEPPKPVYGNFRELLGKLYPRPEPPQKRKESEP